MGDDQRVLAIVDRVEPFQRSFGDIAKAFPAWRSPVPLLQDRVIASLPHLVEWTMSPVAAVSLPEFGSRDDRDIESREQKVGGVPGT